MLPNAVTVGPVSPSLNRAPAFPGYGELQAIKSIFSIEWRTTWRIAPRKLYGSGRDLGALQMSDETMRNSMALTAENARANAAPEVDLSARTRPQECQC